MAQAVQVDFLVSGQVDSSGNRLEAGLVYFYETDGTTLKTIWEDGAKEATASNPHTLSSAGTGQVFADGIYVVVIKTSGGTTVRTITNAYFDPNDTTADVGYIDASEYGSGDDANAIELAITAASGSDQTVLLKPKNWDVDDDITIPTNINLKYQQGAYTTVASGKTLTVSGTIEAPLYNIFRGAGTVTIDDRNIEIPSIWLISGSHDASAHYGVRTYYNGIKVASEDSTLPGHFQANDDGVNKEVFRFDRVSASPADNDTNDINFYSENDNNEQTSFGKIQYLMLDVSNGTEKGEISLWVADGTDGSVDQVMQLDINTLTIKMASIDITTQATDIDIIDNNSSALSFDASGKTGILELVSTNSSEGVKMSGTLNVTGIATFQTDINLTTAAMDIDIIDNNSSALSFDASGKTGILEIVSTNSSEGVKMSGYLNIGASTSVSSVKDEDNMASDSATSLSTQQSIKAYVDAQVATVNTWQEVMDGANTFYTATNDGNPQMRMGATDAEELHIQTVYDSGAQTLDYILFQSDAASGTADKGEFRFNVDGTLVATLDDGGLEVKVSGSISFGAVDILTDSSGTTTLNNIDALDSTTESTIEAAIDTLSNLTTTGALNSGSITSGFGNIDNGSSTITTTGAITGGSVVVDNVTINANDISSTSGNLTITPVSGSAVVIDGGASFDGSVLTGLSALTSTAITGTLQTAAQTNITSLGTLTALNVDNITIDGTTISSSSGITLSAYPGQNVSIESVTMDGGAVGGVTTLATSSTINSQTISSSANLTGTLTVAGVVSLDDTTDSTSFTSGSFHTDGGIGCAKSIIAKSFGSGHGAATGQDLFSSVLDSDDITAEFVDVTLTNYSVGEARLVQAGLFDTSTNQFWVNHNGYTTGQVGVFNTSPPSIARVYLGGTAAVGDTVYVVINGIA